MILFFGLGEWTAGSTALSVSHSERESRRMPCSSLKKFPHDLRTCGGLGRMTGLMDTLPPGYAGDVAFQDRLREPLITHGLGEVE
jgi:hypothetical protein